jgi:Mn-dependent DtxR family transcriptional regulator
MGTTSPTPEPRPGTATDVLAALRRRSRMHVVELSDALDVDPATVDQVCFRLQRAGHVRARGDGEYSITARGEQRLRSLGERQR